MWRERCIPAPVRLTPAQRSETERMDHSIALPNCAQRWTLSAFADEAGRSCDEQIAALCRAGIKRIDMRGIDGYNIAQLPLDHAKVIAGKLEEAGITVAYFGSPIGKIDIAADFQADLEKLDHLGRLSDVLGCKMVRIFSYFNEQGAAMARWQQASLDRLRQLHDRAQQLDLVLVHENERHVFGDRCEQVLLIAEQMRNGQTFRLIFDFDNYHQSGDDVWDNWLKLRDVTDAIHLKDSDERGQHVPVGQGGGRVRAILTDALKRGWVGPLSLEPHLKRSEAVALTGPHGHANESFAELSAEQCFHAAAQAAMSLLGEIQAPVD